MMRNIHFPLKNIYFFLILLVILLAGVGNVDGATRFSVATGNWSSTATWAATSGGTAGASVPVAGDVVTIEGGWTVTVDANSACATLNIASSSTLNFVDTKNFTVSGVTSISGTLNINAYNGTKSFRGLVTVNSGGIWNNSAGSPVNFRGGITNNGTFTVGTGPQTFTNNAQSLTGTLDFSGAAVTITTINLTNQGTLTLTANLSGTGALINSTTGTLNIGGTQTASIATFTNQGTLNLTSSYGINTAFTNTGIVNVQSSGYIAGITNSTGGILNISALSYNINSLTATVAGNTVNYSGLGAQTVINTTYSNLTLSGSGVKTVTGATVGGNLVVSGSATVTPSATFGVAGTTTLSGTSVLTLGAANILSSTPIVLDGGTFSTGATTGLGETVGTLGLTSNSTIALGTGSHTLTFTNSSGVTWTGTTLTITGWTGTWNGTTGTAGHIFVGTTTAGLTTTQLAQIQFYNGSAYFPATILSSGEIVPTCSTVAITSASPGSRCGPGQLTVSATASAGTINWYSSLTGGSSIATGNSYSPTLSTTTTYYVEATLGGCTTSSRTSVTAYIITPPTITAGGSGTFCYGNNINLTSTPSGGSNLYWTGPNSYYSTTEDPTRTSATTNMTGTYTVNTNALSNVNLVINGDFENATNRYLGFTTEYALAAQNATGLNSEGTYDVVALPSSRHGNFCSCVDKSGSGNQLVINGAGTEKTIWSQTVNVVPNTTYQFSYFVQTVVNGNDTNPSKLQLYVNGTAAGPVYKADSITGTWTQFVYNWNSGSGSTTALLALKNEQFALGGNDFAIDNIVFQHTCTASATVNVTVNNQVTAGVIGTNQTICSGTTPATLTSTTAGTGSGTITYEWQTNASGSYVTIAGATAATYSPPALTATTSYQRRTVSVSGGITCYSPYTTAVTITISGPVATAAGPNTVCQAASPTAITLTGASFSGTATNAAWSIISGGGTLSSTASLYTNALVSAVTYTPAANYSGTATLRLTTNTVGGCASISDRTINITAAATVVGGTAISTCSSSSAINITASSSATNYASITWTSSGTGTFANANNLTTCTYTPSAADITAGSVTLTLTATGNSPCGNATSTKTLTINPLPIALVLTGSTICTSPGGNGTITSSTSVNGVSYQLYDASNAVVQTAKAGTGSGLTWSGLAAGTGYYVKGTDGNSCVSPSSNAVNVGTYTNPTALMLTGSTICTSPGGNGTITSSTSVNGVNYQLYDASNAVVQTAKAGTGSGLTWSGLAAGTGYYVKGTDGNSCVSPSSNAVNVGTYTNPTITTTGTVATVCYSASGQTTTLAYSATTNSPTSYSIDWDGTANSAGLTDQSNTAFAFAGGGGSLNTIAITASTTSGGPYSGTMTITNANGCKATQAVTVIVHPVFTVGAIFTTGETICYNGNPGIIGSAIDASGGDGTITYKWEYSLDGFATAGSVISGATSATYDPPTGLTQTTSYRRYAHDGTCNTSFALSTGTWLVTVLNINAIVTNPVSGSDCPGFYAPFNAESGSYNPGVSVVVFKVERQLSTANWNFDFAVSGTDVEVYSLAVTGDGVAPEPSQTIGTSSSGTINAGSENYVALTFSITNKPGKQLDVKLTVSNVVAGSCTESNTTDNTATHTIKPMPVVGSFN